MSSLSRRQAVATLAGTTLLVGCGDQPTTQTTTTPSDLRLRSDAFDPGEPIPTQFTCEGADENPPLRIGNVPSDAATLALVVDDPDAPGDEPFVHWLLWNVPADTTRIPRGVATTERVESLDAVQGRNGFSAVGYRGPCPPTGDGPHTYRFTLTALPDTLGVAPGATRTELAAALDDADSLARTRLTGTFDRSG